jgi:transcriptional regulator with XRE-family HTH domain
MSMPRKKVKTLLKENHITKQELAEEIGITTETLEKNLASTENLKANVVVEIANYFDVSTDYLLGLTDDQTPRCEIMDPLYTKIYDVLKDLEADKLAEMFEIINRIKKFVNK